MRTAAGSRGSRRTACTWASRVPTRSPPSSVRMSSGLSRSCTMGPARAVVATLSPADALHCSCHNRRMQSASGRSARTHSAHRRCARPGRARLADGSVIGEGAGTVVRGGRRSDRARPRGARREHPPPDRLLDEGDDRTHGDRAGQPREPHRRHAGRDPGGAVQRGARSRTRIREGDPAVVGIARLEQRLGNRTRDRCRWRLAVGLLRAREREGTGTRDDVDDVRECVRPR